MEDEVHFLVSCDQYAGLSEDFFNKVANRFNGFTPPSDHEKYIFLMKSDDPYILTRLGKHIALSFIKRCETRMCLCRWTYVSILYASIRWRPGIVMALALIVVIGGTVVCPN